MTSGEAAWALVLGAAAATAELEAAGTAATFAAAGNGALRRTDSSDAGAVISWRPGTGWGPLVDAADPRRDQLDLYLPVASGSPTKPIIVGHLGQSLDGFIATHSGDSQFVTGHENILHLHRMRALCDAVIVGAGTVAADNPQLTTRYVNGPNPLRVVFDPGRRLSADYRIFQDEAARTLYTCAESLIAAAETRVGRAEVVGLQSGAEGVELADLVRVLRERGCHRIFVEGGGVTVSAFLEADLLHRLQVAIAPLLIGDGRPAIRLAARPILRDCRRPSYRVFRMGGDILFDCDLTAQTDEYDDSGPGPTLVTRVI